MIKTNKKANALFNRVVEFGNTFERVNPNLKDVDLEIILKSDFDKYVNWLMNKNPITEEEKKDSFNSLVEYFIEVGKTKKQADKLAHEEIYIKTTYWKSPQEKETALKDLPGNPKEYFPSWRKHSFDEEVSFKISTYENSVLPPEVIQEQEVKRICDKINKQYPIQLLDIIEGRLNEEYYETAQLIGKIDYLKSLHQNDEQQKNLSKKSNAIVKSPDQVFNDFSIVEEVMQENGVTDGKRECFLSSKEAWKIMALIEAIRFYEKELFKAKTCPSDNALLLIFNSHLNTTFKRGKKDSKGFNDFSEGIKNALGRHLAARQKHH